MSPGLSLYAPQGPSELPQCDDLLFLLFAQDIAQARGAHKTFPESMSWALAMAGLQVILHGRFWVPPDAFS